MYTESFSTSTMTYDEYPTMSDRDQVQEPDQQQRAEPRAAAGGGGDAVASRLRETTAAVRVSFTWFGTRKALTNEQKHKIAEGFEAESGSISAGKVLLNTKHPAFRAVTACRNQILEYWRMRSLPFPEPGVRLIKQSSIDAFQAQMEAYRNDLADSVRTLDQHFSEMRFEARRRLGSLYDARDYPETLDGLFAVTWDFPNVEPPDYLMQLRPEIFEAERAKVEAQFAEAVRLAEEDFTVQFSEMVSHLCDRLTRGDDGKAKIFRDSAVHNLNEFFERFGSLNVGSSPQLEHLVNEAKQAIRGNNAQRLRSSTEARSQVSGKLAEVRNALNDMMVDRPRRRIIRPTTERSDEA